MTPLQFGSCYLAYTMAGFASLVFMSVGLHRHPNGGMGAVMILMFWWIILPITTVLAIRDRLRAPTLQRVIL